MKFVINPKTAMPRVIETRGGVVYIDYAPDITKYARRITRSALKQILSGKTTTTIHFYRSKRTRTDFYVGCYKIPDKMLAYFKRWVNR